MLKAHWIVTTGLGSLIFVSAAVAAELAPNSESGPTLEEIVITAQKRTETVQNVPISVTVISNEELTRQGVEDIQDLARASASLEFTAPTAAPGGGGFVRGIGTESVGGASATGSVSIVLDGVVMGNTNVTDIFDLNRVEILKGPQGTLFGSSVSAGVVSLTTNAPDPSQKSIDVTAESSAKDMGSEFSRRLIQTAVNLPVSDDSALRIAAHAYDIGDLAHDTFTGQNSDQNAFGFRARYLLKWNDNLTINLIGDINSEHDSNAPGLNYRSVPAGSALAAALAACGVTPSDRNLDNCSDQSRWNTQLDRGMSAQIDWALGGNTLTSITSYRAANNDQLSDVTTIPVSIAKLYFPVAWDLTTGTSQEPQSIRQHLITEEIRVVSASNQRLDWVGGLYFQHYHYDMKQPETLYLSFATLNLFSDSLVSSDDYAAFGSVTYHATDSTRLLAGARYTHSTVEESKLFDGGTTYETASTSASKPTWRMGVQQDFAQHTMAYLTVSTGYKAPEINDAVSGQLHSIAPELPISYELGLKQSFFENRLAVDGDIFYEQVKDYQGQACVPNLQQAGLVCSAVNVPRVNTKGAELDIFGHPIEGMTLNVSGIYNPATYPANYLASDGTNLGGRQLNYAPKVKLTFSAEQTLPLISGYKLVVGADATYRSSESMFLSALPEYTVGAATLYNARVGIEAPANWSIHVYGRNLGDTIYPAQLYSTSAFAPGGVWQIVDINARRLVGLQLQAKF